MTTFQIWTPIPLSLTKNSLVSVFLLSSEAYGSLRRGDPILQLVFLDTFRSCEVLGWTNWHRHSFWQALLPAPFSSFERTYVCGVQDLQVVCEALLSCCGCIIVLPSSHGYLEAAGCVPMWLIFWANAAVRGGKAAKGIELLWLCKQDPDKADTKKMHSHSHLLSPSNNLRSRDVHSCRKWEEDGAHQSFERTPHSLYRPDSPSISP